MADIILNKTAYTQIVNSNKNFVVQNKGSSNVMFIYSATQPAPTDEGIVLINLMRFQSTQLSTNPVWAIVEQDSRYAAGIVNVQEL